MAFSDDDIARETAKLSRMRVYDYGSIDGPRDPITDQGLEGWRQKLRRESEERFTLKAQGTRAGKPVSVLNWKGK